MAYMCILIYTCIYVHIYVQIVWIVFGFALQRCINMYKMKWNSSTVISFIIQTFYQEYFSFITARTLVSHEWRTVSAHVTAWQIVAIFQKICSHIWKLQHCVYRHSGWTSHSVVSGSSDLTLLSGWGMLLSPWMFLYQVVHSGGMSFWHDVTPMPSGSNQSTDSWRLVCNGARTQSRGVLPHEASRTFGGEHNRQGERFHQEKVKWLLWLECNTSSNIIPFIKIFGGKEGMSFQNVK